MCTVTEHRSAAREHGEVEANGVTACVKKAAEVSSGASLRPVFLLQVTAENTPIFRLSGNRKGLRCQAGLDDV